MYVWNGGGGNDALDGGAGADTAVYSGARTGYSIAGAAAGSVTGPDGTDAVSNQAQLLEMAASYAGNEANIGLVGLQQSGVAFV